MSGKTIDISAARVAGYIKAAKSGLENQVQGFGSLVSNGQDSRLTFAIPTISIEHARQRLRSAPMQRRAEIGVVVTGQGLDHDLQRQDVPKPEAFSCSVAPLVTNRHSAPLCRPHATTSDESAGALNQDIANAVRARCTERVRKILAETLNLSRNDPRRQLADDAPLTSWGVDSLDHMELIFSVEDEFDVDILESDEAQLDTVGKVVDHILRGQAS